VDAVNEIPQVGHEGQTTCFFFSICPLRNLNAEHLSKKSSGYRF